MGCGEGRHSIGAFIETQVNILGLDLSIKDLNIAKDRLNDFETSGIDAVCRASGRGREAAAGQQAGDQPRVARSEEPSERRATAVARLGQAGAG